MKACQIATLTGKNDSINTTKFPVLTTFLCVLLGMVGQLCGMENAGAASTNYTVRLVLELKDGSRVEGEPLQTRWPLRTELVGLQRMDLNSIGSVEMTKETNSRVNFKNGDKLTANLELNSVELKTAFGEVKIRTDLIRTIHFFSVGGTRHALKFNWGSRVEIPNDSQLQFGEKSFAISFWLKTESERPLITFISKRTSSFNGWVLHQYNGQLFFMGAGGGSAKSQPVSIRDGQWHHVAVVRTDSLITLYLDGKNVGSGEDRCNHDDTNPIRIGMDCDGDTCHFEGGLSEVHFYSRALSSAEVAEEWNAGERKNGAMTDGLIAGYHFDEGRGSVVRDFSQNNHDGILINGPEWSD